MASLSPSKIIGMVIALILIGVLLPIGIADLTAFTDTNSTIQTLVAEVIPIMAIVSLVLMIIPSRNK